MILEEGFQYTKNRQIKKRGQYYVKFIDFGLIDQIYTGDGEHVEEREGVGAKGTLNYMSRAAHEGKRLSRRDDWESIVYVIIMLVNGHLPWQGMRGKDQMETS